MALLLEEDRNGKERTDFSDLRDWLHELDTPFEVSQLSELSYEDLTLCGTATAGKAICSPEAVKEEREHRRRRFVQMDASELAACERYLRASGMYFDVLKDRAHRTGLRWDELNERQQVWASMRCLYNHLDNPKARLLKTTTLFRLCAASGSLPPEVATAFRRRIDNLRVAYPEAISDKHLREGISEIADGVLAFLPDEEKDQCLRFEIRDFQCTSDCFRGLRIDHV